MYRCVKQLIGAQTKTRRGHGDDECTARTTRSGIIHEQGKIQRRNKNKQNKKSIKSIVLCFVFVFVFFLGFGSFVAECFGRRTWAPMRAASRAHHNATSRLGVCVITVRIAGLGKAVGRLLANPEPPVVWSLYFCPFYVLSSILRVPNGRFSRTWGRWQTIFMTPCD